jgi:hypothetical protein
MKRERTLYDVELTYRDANGVIDPAEYQRMFFRATEAEIQQIKEVFIRRGELHIKALFESIRRHSRTKKGKGWNGEMTAVLSCSKGNVGLKTLHQSVQCYPDLAKKIDYFISVCNYPDRLHVHLLVNGKPGRTIVERVHRYWSRKHGMVKKQKIEQSDLTGWYTEYVQSQSICTKRCKFG